MIRIWLDDIREIPEGYTHWCKTPEEAIVLLSGGKVSYISFDHDLGLPEPENGNMVAKWIEEKAYSGEILPLNWDIHSANPTGYRNIRDSMLSAERFWKMKGND